MNNDEEHGSVNSRVASLEEANEQVERLLRQVLESESGAAPSALEGQGATSDTGEPRSGRDMLVPDVLDDPSAPKQSSKAEPERPVSEEEVQAAKERVERLRSGTGTLSAQLRKIEEKESGFFASVGAAVLRALHVE